MVHTPSATALGTVIRGFREGGARAWVLTATASLDFSALRACASYSILLSVMRDLVWMGDWGIAEVTGGTPIRPQASVMTAWGRGTGECGWWGRARGEARDRGKGKRQRGEVNGRGRHRAREAELPAV